MTGDTSARTQSALRQEILQKFNIHLRHDKQLTVFRQWIEEQDFRDKVEETVQRIIAARSSCS